MREPRYGRDGELPLTRLSQLSRFDLALAADPSHIARVENGSVEDVPIICAIAARLLKEKS